VRLAFRQSKYTQESEEMTDSDFKLDDEELQVICNIIEAAIWYTVAEELEMGISPKSM
jgi:hypothetical protein